MRKVVLTCAVVGENEYNRAHPNFPITPEQIADAAKEAADAGASAVHLHVRNPKAGVGSRDPDLFAEMVAQVRARRVESIINVTCGGGGTFIPDPIDEARGGPGTDMASAEERVRHVEMTMPEMCSIDVSNRREKRIRFHEYTKYFAENGETFPRARS